MEGTILKAFGGFFYVSAGEDENDLMTCRVRGRLEEEGTHLLVGDRVQVSRVFDDDDVDGVITARMPRNSELTRPPVANIDQVVVVSSLDEPEVNFYLLDRMLVLIEEAGLDLLLVLNKIDLRGKEGSEAEEIFGYYTRQLDYQLVKTSALEEVGITELHRELGDHISVFAGQTGVGKSALLNAIHPVWSRETGRISEKSGRGRHTTRRVELLRLDEGGLVADSPGFMRLDIGMFPPEELTLYFREIAEFAAECRFRGCVHDQEPGCAVKKAVADGEIMESRYENYRRMLEELTEKYKNQY